jgi:hypothetical protein
VARVPVQSAEDLKPDHPGALGSGEGLRKPPGIGHHMRVASRAPRGFHELSGDSRPTDERSFVGRLSTPPWMSYRVPYEVNCLASFGDRRRAHAEICTV